MQLTSLHTLGLQTTLPANVAATDAALMQEVLSALRAVLRRHHAEAVVIGDSIAPYLELKEAAAHGIVMEVDSCWNA